MQVVLSSLSIVTARFWYEPGHPLRDCNFSVFVIISPHAVQIFIFLLRLASAGLLLVQSRGFRVCMGALALASCAIIVASATTSSNSKDAGTCEVAPQLVGTLMLLVMSLYSFAMRRFYMLGKLARSSTIMWLGVSLVLSFIAFVGGAISALFGDSVPVVDGLRVADGAVTLSVAAIVLRRIYLKQQRDTEHLIAQKIPTQVRLAKEAADSSSGRRRGTGTPTRFRKASVGKAFHTARRSSSVHPLPSRPSNSNRQSSGNAASSDRKDRHDKCEMGRSQLGDSSLIAEHADHPHLSRGDGDSSLAPEQQAKTNRGVNDND
eukprot:TRINITY_DN25371_c0_g1_i1.p1 TRINITY_DN25371_c0_g1~~TRINITY_DN25371_c0_g1_i1.p1  ORF type:complete len:320 (+),score=84.65 TRINITY_DN25371_c0_g1_i1:126-1085(+)